MTAITVGEQRRAVPCARLMERADRNRLRCAAGADQHRRRRTARADASDQQGRAVGQQGRGLPAHLADGLTLRVEMRRVPRAQQHHRQEHRHPKHAGRHTVGSRVVGVHDAAPMGS
jgi:hypothetical protein